MSFRPSTTTVLRYVVLICFAFVGGHSSSVIAQRPSGDCATFEYSNRNQVDPPPLTIRGISGRVIDSNEVAIPQGCVGLFTEPGHQLIKTAAVDDSGKFYLRDINPGRYRLLVSVSGFCIANVRVRVAKWPRGGLFSRRTVVVHMEPAGIDRCSYIFYK